ncbi:putative cytochrome P450 [Stachybotrys elegans]|uniref:Cytochrome P450 n=1 Tax=Stachybotrys elegans TaxID=80388 RepID=A0A8K0SGN9_9HYPO|nr:putative cytochrome P450 [Stachybotrys elegans]
MAHDAREPPLASSSIPIIGHAIGLARRSFEYYVDLSKQTNAPIVTVSLPGQKMYVVTKPDLIQQAQKQHRTLAFPPIAAKFATTVVGLSKEAQVILADNVNGDDGDHGLSMETYTAMRVALKPGPELDDMNRAMLAEINKMLHQLSAETGTKLSLYAWLQDSLTVATTRAIYGPMNPFEDKEIADAFWDFEEGLMSIVIGFLPSLTARKPVAARNKAVRAFQEYYKNGGIEQASAYAKSRYEVEVSNKFPPEDIARSSVGGTIALLVNTVPGVFWTMLHIFSYTGLLQQVRAEIDACTRTSDPVSDGDNVTNTIDVATLKENCPLLLSTYHEVLRYRTIGSSVREVREDTELGPFLLKKGAMLQMPARVIHTDASCWGNTDFNPSRFLPEEKKSRPGDICFRAFGGGKTLCPGRHFATNEILAVVALFIARFDVKEPTGGWKMPTTTKTNVAAAAMGPDNDVDIEFMTREGFKGISWAVKLEASDKIFSIVSEDL